ncbi:ribosome biogenesis GTP-binding protein YihA/YsxC [Nitratifractor salsuginis]|uniref:Probable GTP-binding protein EngB n=1 Tax=Nitratifractor salsuginis (strain DSM 16511 / JCM 12458 / E9I37-1) TaxID=749222 RepID=E6X359_NITSE|nr:ribosome biogenesis GTP-binding protein YihA/YsxC [Nitratifractor salsuginis]ADV46203.1 ribosome biogenesis GTP-binding protein YsxC [Nitratifractor salsuginis DSM 16511]
MKASRVPRPVRAEFVKSAQSINDSVDESLSEVVFLGRSNVGKSSTINLLAGRKNLAKSSATPGKTRLINFFDVGYKLDDKDYTVRFVDLPGFGYAKVSKSMKDIWQKNLVEFIKNRVAIRLFIHLRDARHPHAKIDEDVARYIGEFLRPDQRYLTVFTKADKLNQKERAALLRDYPGAILISNLKKTGQERIQQAIFETIFGEKFQ